MRRAKAVGVLAVLAASGLGLAATTGGAESPSAPPYRTEAEALAHEPNCVSPRKPCPRWIDSQMWVDENGQLHEWFPAP